MGSYVFGPCPLNMPGVANELWMVQYYASDVLLIFLSSARIIEKFVNIECNNHGNMALTCTSLLFMRARLYDENAKDFRYRKYLCICGL